MDPKAVLMSAAEGAPAEVVKALNMYGVYSFKQLEELQDQVGMYCQQQQQTAPTEGPSKRRRNESGPSSSIPPQTSDLHSASLGLGRAQYHHDLDEEEDEEEDDDDDNLMQAAQGQAGANGAAPPRARQYRDPEKRREQNRRASQRARHRARQREEQVVMLQQQLQKMQSEMSRMKVQLDDAKVEVKQEKWLAEIRTNKKLAATSNRVEARGSSFSHPPLREENDARRSAFGIK